MAVISIRPMNGGGLVVHGRTVPVGRLSDADVVRLNVDAVATATTAFHTAMQMVRVCSDTNCWIDIASAAVSTPSATGDYLPAGAVEYLEINPRGGVLSVVQK